MWIALIFIVLSSIHAHFGYKQPDNTNYKPYVDIIKKNIKKSKGKSKQKRYRVIYKKVSSSGNGGWLGRPWMDIEDKSEICPNPKVKGMTKKNAIVYAQKIQTHKWLPQDPAL